MDERGRTRPLPTGSLAPRGSPILLQAGTTHSSNLVVATTISKQSFLALLHARATKDIQEDNTIFRSTHRKTGACAGTAPEPLLLRS